jgi:hypothetical protein
MLRVKYVFMWLAHSFYPPTFPLFSRLNVDTIHVQTQGHIYDPALTIWKLVLIKLTAAATVGIPELSVFIKGL